MSRRAGSARCKPAGARHRVRWGQNFLADPSVARAMVSWASLDDAAAVLEIGPGRGALTEYLVERARRLVVIEIDPRLAAALRERFGGRRAVEVIEADARDFDYRTLGPGPWTIVASLPYESGTAIVQRLLDLGAGAVREMVVMLQREVVERLVARPGDTHYGRLAVHTTLRADVEAGRVVGPSAFRPRPRVESQLVRLRPLDGLRYDVGSVALFNEFVANAFSGRRKMIRNTLGRVLAGRVGAPAAARILTQAGVDERARPQEIAVEQFAAIARRATELSRAAACGD